MPSASAPSASIPVRASPPSTGQRSPSERISRRASSAPGRSAASSSTSAPPRRVGRGGAAALLLAAERPGAELALREMRSLGLRWPVLGGDALTGIEAGGALAEGMRLSSAYLPDRREERNVAFVAVYARAFPGQRPDHRGAGAYDILLLLADRKSV